MKKFFFFLLLPIFAPLMMLLFVLNDHDNGKGGFMANLAESRNIFSKILFGILFVVTLPIVLLMNWAFDAWEKLSD